jgi:hypothetical protein
MSTEIEGENFSSSEPTASQAPKNGSSGESTAGSPGSTTLVRKATGPRTQQGKERSKHNAVKHGIFSKVVLLKGESQTEFDALLSGLRDDRQPVGTLEELLVEKLAALVWRNRRLFIAECAEIRARAEFVEWDEKERQREKTATLPQLSCNGGLIRQIANPEALQGCLDLLIELKINVGVKGFDPDHDNIILVKVYGGPDKEAWRQTIYHLYFYYLTTSVAPDAERQQKGFPSPQDSKDYFLAELDEEIERLRKYKMEQETILLAKAKMESLRQNVPDTPQLDRLLRYETSLERSIERTLNQLERSQRMRLGRPVPPSINLTIT